MSDTLCLWTWARMMERTELMYWYSPTAECWLELNMYNLPRYHFEVN
jgi:hypothetical protein